MTWLKSDKEVVLTYRQSDVIVALFIALLLLGVAVLLQYRMMLWVQIETMRHEVRTEELLRAVSYSGLSERMDSIEQAVVDKRFLVVYGKFLNALEERDNESERKRRTGGSTAQEFAKKVKGGGISPGKEGDVAKTFE